MIETRLSILCVSAVSKAVRDWGGNASALAGDLSNDKIFQTPRNCRGEISMIQNDEQLARAQQAVVNLQRLLPEARSAPSAREYRAMSEPHQLAKLCLKPTS